MTNTLNKIIHNGDEYEFPDKTYTAGDGIDIDSNNEISNSQPGAIVSASQPSSATEGDLWYDTANDVLKSYNGSAWVEVGNDSADINTKTFFINDSSEEMTKIQEAYTWVADGGEAILYYTYSTRAYYISGKIDSSGTLTFTGSLNWLKYEVNQAYSRLTYNNLIVYATDGTVTSIRFEDAAGKYIDILETSKTYPVPYIPTDPSHPTTKKYVDDRDTYIGSSEPTSNKVEGRLWYDTTNDQLKVYDGTNWNVVGDDADDINTKTFYLSSTSDLTTAQAAYDWYKSGKNPIVVYTKRSYFIYDINSTQVKLTGNTVKTATNPDSKTLASSFELTFTKSGNTISSISSTSSYINYLDTNVNYSTPYTPQYNGSPATKKYVDDRDTYIGSSEPTSNKVEGRLWYDTTNDQLKVYDGTNWNVTGKEYNAGKGIEIGTVQDYSAMQGPAPDGFHVPSKNEWVALCGILTTTFSMASNDTTMGTYLKMPMAGNRSKNSNVINVGGYGRYWSSTPLNSSNSYYLEFSSSIINPQTNNYPVYACSVRCFKDVPTVPTSSWTTLYDGSSIATGAGVFYNATDGLISVSGDGTTWYTIQDKNLGATTVYNQGDTETDANCGYLYQRGNNYGFPHSGTVTTSSTQVDASNYGPGNYYNSSTFIIGSNNWSNVQNNNLWGATTGVVTTENAITNTGVLSVNGQTGNVTVEPGITKVFTLTDLTSSSNLAIATEAYQWYLNGGDPIIDYNGRRYHLDRVSSSELYLTASYVYNSNYLYFYTLKLTISSGAVTAITLINKGISTVSGLPSSPETNTIYFTTS